MTTQANAQNAPREQAKARCLGTWTPPTDTRLLSLHVLGNGATIIIRARASETTRPETVAEIEHDGGVVRQIEWTSRASTDQSWREFVGHWVAAKIAADWADQAGRS